MNRREFFKTGAQVAVVGAAATAQPCSALADAIPTSPASSSLASAILKDYTADDHRWRLQNIGVCHREIRTCMRKHLVTNYLHGQCCYNLGEYPCRKPWDPDEYDERGLDRLKDQGIQLIQVMDDWNDQLRLCGGHKLTALNPDGFRRFVDMVHQRGDEDPDVRVERVLHPDRPRLP